MSIVKYGGLAGRGERRFIEVKQRPAAIGRDERGVQRVAGAQFYVGAQVRVVRPAS